MPVKESREIRSESGANWGIPRAEFDSVREWFSISASRRHRPYPAAAVVPVKLQTASILQCAHRWHYDSSDGHSSKVLAVWRAPTSNKRTIDQANRIPEWNNDSSMAHRWLVSIGGSSMIHQWFITGQPSLLSLSLIWHHENYADV